VLAIVITKGGVALLTVPYCHLKLALFSGRSLAILAGASLLGLLLYFLGINTLGREVAEISALVPITVLAWRWRTETAGEA
jgi:hypothetical protein